VIPRLSLKSLDKETVMIIRSAPRLGLAASFVLACHATAAAELAHEMNPPPGFTGTLFAMPAEGRDGRKLQLRGGGLVRFLPVDSGLDLFARSVVELPERAKLPTSVMPEGLVADLSLSQFASLLDSIDGMKIK
jgi:hypothetical protein